MGIELLTIDQWRDSEQALIKLKKLCKLEIVPKSTEILTCFTVVHRIRKRKNTLHHMLLIWNRPFSHKIMCINKGGSHCCEDLYVPCPTALWGNKQHD